MDIIIDSGSTKSDWVFLRNGVLVFKAKTIGLNPHFIGPDEVRRVVGSFEYDIDKNLPHQLYFYGAGCGSMQGKELISNSLIEIFPRSSIHVYSDLLGAARSLLQAKSGYIAVLGTGSSSAYYNGTKILEMPPSLGYLLGDEGSGNAIGKLVLKDFLMNRLPQDVVNHHLLKNLNYERALHKLYKETFQNRFLASLAEIAYDHKSNPHFKNLLKTVFSQFFQEQRKCFGKELKTISLCGSIAWYFKDEIVDVAAGFNIETGKIEKSPIAGLITFHTGN